MYTRRLCLSWLLFTASGYAQDGTVAVRESS